MILRCVIWSIFLCLALQQTAKAQVKIDDKGYQNVLISFAPNVPSEAGKELVQSIQDLLEGTSSVLHAAIDIRIASATFRLPSSWPAETWEDITVTPASPEQTNSRPDIRVDATEHNPFGKRPVALQHGGCGVAGRQITLPLDFVSSTDAHAYPKEKLLAREWLKYRYGVFDENGFPGDSLYPDYYRIPGSSEIRITECTDSEVTYTFKKPVVGETCDMESETDFGHCRAHPDEESAANVTSSLMYFHEGLSNMEHICGKDNHTHHSTSRNKQNALCNGQSIWDVVKQSKDFPNLQYQYDDPVPETIQFSYIQESQPRFVVLLENSDNLLEKETPIRFALKRFYYDLPPKSKLALYTYNSDAAEVLPYTVLPAEGRADLRTIADFASPPTSICTSCGLAKAMEVLQQNSDLEKGSILLITASPLELSDKLESSDICLRVLRFADDSEDKSYDGLKESFGCFHFEFLQNNLDDLQTFHSLTNFLTNDVPEFREDFEIKTIVSGEMSSQIPVTLPLDATASLYVLWLSKSLGAAGIDCRAGETAVTLNPGMSATDIASFTFDPVEGDVTCNLTSTKFSAILTQVQMKTQKGHYFDFDTWIHHVPTEGNQLPIIIYAKIYFGGYPVKGANVTMVVTSENNPERIVKMLDNGRGDPDVTQYDGIYSGYFTDFVEKGEYQITVKIDDNGGEAKIGKENPSSNSAPCCGSIVISQEEDVPPFEMQKRMAYNATNEIPADGYPPSKIFDPQVMLDNSSNVVLSWTAPGGGKASSYEFYTFCDLEDCDDGKFPEWLKLNETEPRPKSYGEPEEVVILFTPEILKFEYLPLFFAIKSVGERGKRSDLSNKAEILLSFLPEQPTTTFPVTDEIEKQAASDTTGIIVGCTVIGAFLLLCLGTALHFCVIKPRKARAELSDIHAKDKSQNGTEVSGSFRAVPVRNRDSFSMRRVESFPVLLYTHDQLKDFKKKVDPPLYKPDIPPRPWMSMNVLSNSELKKGSDSKSIGSASTLPMNDKQRSVEMEQLDDVSLASDTPNVGEAIKL